MSIDLSQAFDMLPREVTLSALQFARVHADVCALVTHIHETVQYGVEHQGHKDNIDTRRGVRQGCTLPPTLFEIFTAYFTALLKERTDATWAQNFVTLFADDSHLSWEVESTADLAYVLKCMRATYQLFTELGMKVNSNKSAIILGVRGRSARKWLKPRLQMSQGRQAVDMGVVGQPLSQSVKR